jgi:hypothetical protein
MRYPVCVANAPVDRRSFHANFSSCRIVAFDWWYRAPKTGPPTPFRDAFTKPSIRSRPMMRMHLPSNVTRRFMSTSPRAGGSYRFWSHLGLLQRALRSGAAIRTHRGDPRRHGRRLEGREVSDLERLRVFADRYERGSMLITTNLPFSEWNQIFQGERMTAAHLDRLNHRRHFRDEWRKLPLSRVDEDLEESTVTYGHWASALRAVGRWMACRCRKRFALSRRRQAASRANK